MKSPLPLNSRGAEVRGLSADARSLTEVRRVAATDPQRAARTAATQFESLFLNMILKSMRDALPKDGLMSSSAGESWTGMLDQQLAQKLAAQGTGLGDLIARQLTRNMQKSAPGTASAADVVPANAQTSSTLPARLRRLASSPPRPAGAGSSVAVSSPTHAVPAAPSSQAAGNIGLKRDFLVRVVQHARAVESETGIPAKFMIGQAALETGWGRNEIKAADGQPSFNLFGIKAGSNWSGATVEVTTTEYLNGVARKVVEKFRAYASYAESFADYAKLLSRNPRYAGVLQRAAAGPEQFAASLQRAGYATDPAYAQKLSQVIRSTPV